MQTRLWPEKIHHPHDGNALSAHYYLRQDAARTGQRSGELVARWLLSLV